MYTYCLHTSRNLLTSHSTPFYSSLQNPRLPAFHAHIVRTKRRKNVFLHFSKRKSQLCVRFSELPRVLYSISFYSSLQNSTPPTVHAHDPNDRAYPPLPPTFNREDEPSLLPNQNHQPSDDPRLSTLHGSAWKQSSAMTVLGCTNWSGLVGTMLRCKRVWLARGHFEREARKRRQPRVRSYRLIFNAI